MLWRIGTVSAIYTKYSCRYWPRVRVNYRLQLELGVYRVRVSVRVKIRPMRRLYTDTLIPFEMCTKWVSFFVESVSENHSWVCCDLLNYILNFGLVFSERELTFTFAICYHPSVCRLSVCRLSVVCNVRAPYSGGSNFRQYFYGIRYLGHPLTSTENFTEIVPGEPLRRRSWTQEG